MVFDEDRVVAAADGFELVAYVVAHHSQHDGEGERPQQEDGVHQDEAGGIVLRQHVHACKGRSDHSCLWEGRLLRVFLPWSVCSCHDPWLGCPMLGCCMRSVPAVYCFAALQDL